jgi:hypothetical protein
VTLVGISSTKARWGPAGAVIATKEPTKANLIRWLAKTVCWRFAQWEAANYVVAASKGTAAVAYQASSLPMVIAILVRRANFKQKKTRHTALNALKVNSNCRQASRIVTPSQSVTLGGTLSTRARWGPAGAVIALKTIIVYAGTNSHAMAALWVNFNKTSGKRSV